MRVLERLDRLYAIGGGPGANRLGGTREEDEAHELVAGWMREAGLEVEVDSAGTCSGGCGAGDPSCRRSGPARTSTRCRTAAASTAPSAWSAAWRRSSALGQRERTLVVVAFRDEEGCTGPGCRGSRSLCSGRLDRRRRRSSSCMSSRVPSLRVDAPLGVVTGIAATARGEVVFEGREGHAGTTPMPRRDDALVAAAELVLRLRDAAAAVDGAVATVGRLAVEPGASNVIPARAALSVDIRAPDDERLEQVAAVVPASSLGTRGGDVAGPRAVLLEELRRAGWPPSSSPLVRATTRACSRPRACRPRCSSSAA